MMWAIVEEMEGEENHEDLNAQAAWASNGSENDYC